MKKTISRAFFQDALVIARKRIAKAETVLAREKAVESELGASQCDPNVPKFQVECQILKHLPTHWAKSRKAKFTGHDLGVLIKKADRVYHKDENMGNFSGHIEVFLLIPSGGSLRIPKRYYQALLPKPKPFIYGPATISLPEPLRMR